MTSRYYKKKIKIAIKKAARRLFHDSGQPKKTYLYLTRKQYECDPDGWHDVLRQHGLPDNAIIFIPDVFDSKGGDCR